MRIEHRLGNRHQRRMRHPGAIAAIGDFAQLVLPYFFHCGVVCDGVVLDRNLRRHATHGRCTAPMAGLHQQQGIGPHEGRGHGDLRPIGQTEFAVGAEFFDAGKNIVPAADVQTGRVFAQLPQELVHFEGCHHGLNQTGGANAARGYAQRLLCHDKNIVPQPRFQMRLHLRQIEIRT